MSQMMHCPTLPGQERWFHILAGFTKDRQTKTAYKKLPLALAADLWASWITWASLPQPRYHPFKMLKIGFVMCQPHPLIDSYDPHGNPLRRNLASLSELKPCAPNRCHKRTILVYLLASWVSFLQVVQAKNGTASICRQQPVPMLHWQQHSKQRVFYCDVTHSVIDVRGASHMKSSKIFHGVILGSRMAVLEPRYPVPL